MVVPPKLGGPRKRNLQCRSDGGPAPRHTGRRLTASDNIDASRRALLLVSGTGGLRFKFWAGQIGHRVANARHPCDVSSKGAVLSRHNDAEMGPANSLHASAYYSEYNERFDFMFITLFTSYIALFTSYPLLFLLLLSEGFFLAFAAL